MAIKLDHVTKKFGEKKVLYDFSACFEENKTTFLSGPSGAGKTTILNLIMGFYPPDSGQILGVYNRKIACVFQDKRLFLKETALTNVSCVIPNEERFSLKELFFRKNQQNKKQAKYWLELLGLSKYCEETVENLSGGMQQLVSLARAFAAPKDILLLDEPFTGLHQELKCKVVDLIRENFREITTVLVTHDQEAGKQLAQKIFTLNFLQNKERQVVE